VKKTTSTTARIEQVGCFVGGLCCEENKRSSKNETSDWFLVGCVVKKTIQ